MPRIGDNGKGGTPVAPKAEPITYLGIDPGKKGGLTWLNGDTITHDRMPETEHELWRIIGGDLARFKGSKVIAVVEWVGGFFKQRGEKNQPGSAMFNFGFGVGTIHMALIASGRVTYDVVRPQKWQKAMECIGGKEKKTVNQRRAQQLFPGVKINQPDADAFIIAEFCRRRHQGRL